MGIETGATKRMWLNRWNKVGEFLADAFSGELKVPAPIKWLVSLLITIVTILFAVGYYAIYPISEGIRNWECLDVWDHIGHLLWTAFAYAGIFIVITMSYINYMDFKGRKQATTELIQSAMSSSACVKDYLPKVLDHKLNVKKINEPLTINDVEAAISECKRVNKSYAEIQDQRKAMGAVK